MIRGGVKRLAQMDAAEIRWRVRTRGRALIDRVTTGFVSPAWKRERLLSAVAAAPALAAARSALGRHDWSAAHLELSQHFAQAPHRFVVWPPVKHPLIESVARGFPASARQAAARADRLLAGEYDLLGYRGLRFDPTDAADAKDAGGPAPAVDWHFDPVHQRRAPKIAWSMVPFLDPSCGDHKIIWELNRHQHWLALGRAYWLTGDRKYRDRFVHELEDWMAANPPLVGINWASMLELALRSLSWVWALALFVDAERDAVHDSTGDGGAAPWSVDLLLGLDVQLTHIERHLSSYFSPNTHLLGEALALYVCSMALPELAASARRADTGRRILLSELGRQIGTDGGHLERSTHYHRYALDFYLLALLVARINGDPAASTFERAVSGLASAARLLSDDRGRIPHIGDDDGGMLMPLTGRSPHDLRDSLAVAAAVLERPELCVGRVPEEALWLLANDSVFADLTAPSAGRPPHRRIHVRSGALEDTGYYVSRTAASDHLVIDGGAHGYQNGGHAHADALSLTFSVHGLPLLIDPGTGTYTADAAIRERFRSTALHNTVTIDGRSSSAPDGPFHWSHTANSRVERWRTGEAFDYFDGFHDGYRPLTHRRSVLALHGDLLIVTDIVLGSGTHTVATHWHIDPGWAVQVAGRHATFTRRAERVTLTVPDGTIDTFLADTRHGLGWHSPAYGRVEPATTLRIVREAALPMSMTAVFGLSPENSVDDVAVLPEARDGSLTCASALKIARAASADYMVIAGPGTVAAGARPAITRIGDLETDARMLFYRVSAGRSVTRLAFVDGSLVRAVGGPGLRLELPAEAPHYFADFDTAHVAPRNEVDQKRNDGPCAASPVS